VERGITFISLAFLLIICSAFALPFDTKTENGLKVGIQPVSNVVNGNTMTTCYWAQLPAATMTKPSISTASFGFSKAANITSASTQLVRANLDYKYETYVVDNCTTDKDGKEICNPYNQTDRIDVWTYPSAASSSEVLYCFDTILKKDKNNHIQLPTKNSFNITLASMKADPDLDVCAILNSSGTVDLTGNVTKLGGNCFTINSTGVSIDCHGFSIIGNNSASSRGITSIVAGFNVRNCNIINFSTGIYVGGDSIDYTNITNNTFSSGFATSCSQTNGACCAIYQTAADFAVISNNYIYGHSTSYGIALNTASTTNNNITNNTVNSTAIAYVVNAASNNNIFQNNTAIETYTAGFSFTTSFTSNTIKDNLVVNTSGGPAYSLSTGSNNNVLVNNTAINISTYGVRLFSSSENLVVGNYLQTNYQQTSAGVVYLTSLSSNNTFENNTLNSTSYAAGVYDNGGKNNTFTNNTIIGSHTLGYGFTFIAANAGENTITLNNITTYHWVSDLNDTNYYNDSTAGNIYYFPNGTGAWEVSPNGTALTTTSPPNWNTNTSAWINATTFSGNWTGYGTDFLPWTANAGAGAPVHNATIIIYLTANTTTGLNLSNENINCNGTPITNDTGTMIFRGSWLLNGTNLTSLNWSIAISNNTNTILSTLAFANFGATDNISCTGYADDGTNTSAQNWSNNVTVIAGAQPFIARILATTGIWTYAQLKSGNTTVTWSGVGGEAWIWHIWATGNGNKTISYDSTTQTWTWVNE